MAAIHPEQKLCLAAATISLGAPGTHDIIAILQAAASVGLKGIEMFYNHLAHHAAKASNTNIEQVSPDALLDSAKTIHEECAKLGITVFALQPFAQYDGVIDQTEHTRLIHKFELWIKLAHILQCPIIQIPTNMVKTGTTGDIDKIVSDISELADIARHANPVINLAYESIAWGAHNDLWEHSWEVVKRVDRPNVGLCLDTYHIAARVWADPRSTTGQSANAEADLRQSLQRLLQEVALDKIFYLQFSDAERLSAPLIEGHPFYHPDQPPLMSWARNARLFPCEEDRGGYFPVAWIADTVVNQKGYRGWISMEIFSRHNAALDADVPRQYAERAKLSYEKMRAQLQWQGL